VEVQVKNGGRASIRHAYTHFRITLHAFSITSKTGKPKALACKDWQWVSAAALARLAFSKADRKILEAICNSQPG
jgi:A/G-specific adenine glycosylase